MSSWLLGPQLLLCTGLAKLFEMTNPASSVLHATTQCISTQNIRPCVWSQLLVPLHAHALVLLCCKCIAGLDVKTWLYFSLCVQRADRFSTCSSRLQCTYTSERNHTGPDSTAGDTNSSLSMTFTWWVAMSDPHLSGMRNRASHRMQGMSCEFHASWSGRRFWHAGGSWPLCTTAWGSSTRGDHSQSEKWKRGEDVSHTTWSQANSKFMKPFGRALIQLLKTARMATWAETVWLKS